MHVTAVVEGRNTELPGIAETDLRATSREVKEEGLELSITEGGKEGKSKVTALCSFLEDEVSRVDLRTRTKQLGSERKRAGRCVM